MNTFRGLGTATSPCWSGIRTWPRRGKRSFVMRSRKNGAVEAKGSPRPDEALQLLAQREYSLHALMDLSQALAQSHDLYATMDALLLNLMGQFRLSRSCLWLLPENMSEPPVLVRSRGVDGGRARILMTTCAPLLLDRLRE